MGDRKQRRPGCRRKKTRKRGDCLESHSDPLTDTSTTPDDIQTTPAAAKQLIGHSSDLRVVFLRALPGFHPQPNPFSIQTTKDFAFKSFSLSNKNFHSKKKKRKKKKKS